MLEFGVTAGFADASIFYNENLVTPGYRCQTMRDYEDGYSFFT